MKWRGRKSTTSQYTLCQVDHRPFQNCTRRRRTTLHINVIAGISYQKQCALLQNSKWWIQYANMKIMSIILIEFTLKLVLSVFGLQMFKFKKLKVVNAKPVIKISSRHVLPNGDLLMKIYSYAEEGLLIKIALKMFNYFSIHNHVKKLQRKCLVTSFFIIM